MSNSINTNIAALSAQANIALASNQASGDVARLSSGNRIVQASDDVTALAIGTSLGTQVSALKTAQTNASQGTSLLQVADGALSQIQSILQQMQSVANQAQSGSLTDTDRGFLNQQFQALSAQVDSLSSGTTFNGVTLLNGSLTQAAALADTTTHSTAGTLNLTFNTNILSGKTVIINGVTLTAAATSSGSSGANFALGASLADTVANLATQLNAMSSNSTYAPTIGQATYSANGNTLVITANSGGSLSNTFAVSTAGTATRSGGASLAGTGVAGNDTSFNLFTTAVADANITSATKVLSADAAAAGTPFQNGNSITAYVDGVSKTLYTFGSASDGGARTVSDIVNGINLNSASTGFKAALVYDGTGYNIRLNYTGTGGNIRLDMGANYNAGTYIINGQSVNTTSSETSSTSAIEAAAGATDSQYLFYTNRLLLSTTTTSITTANENVADATNTVGNTAAGTPFARNDNITVTINGVTKVLYTIPNAATTLDTIINGINANTANTGVYAVLTGSGGGYGVRLYVNDPDGQYSAASGGPNANAVISAQAISQTGATLTQTTRTSLGGGTDNGISQGSTAVTGTIGDNILESLSQTPAQESINLTQNAVAGDSIVVGGHTFYFTSNTNTAVDEITIGSTLTDTIDNAVSKLNSYLSNGYALNSEAYELNQMSITRSGNSLVFTAKGLGSVKQIDTTTNATITNSITGASTAGNLHNEPTTYGVNMTGVTNGAFIGQVTGFSGLYDSANTADLSIKVGNYTYTAKSVTTNPGSDTVVRFYSNTLGDGSNGGYFDIQMKGGDGLAVNGQSDVTTLTNRLNTAFSSLNFLQKHNVSSYSGTQSIVANNTVIGSLIGSSVSAQLSSFTNQKLTAVSVTAPSGSNTDAKITLTINGVNYSTASGLGSTLGANQTYKLVSANDPNQFISFTTGNTGIDMSSAENAAAVQSALFNAFGATAGAAALTFQLGTTASSVVNVSLDNTSTSALFGGAVLDVSSAADAAIASTAVQTALDKVTAARSNVGALESRFNFASAALQTSVQNQTAAQSALLDTDIAATSTSFATAQVKLQAGISVLAQANQQLQALLKLIA